MYDDTATPELVCISALSLGLIQLGTGHGELTETLVGLLMEGRESIVTSTFARFICLGLGLLYLGLLFLFSFSLSFSLLFLFPLLFFFFRKRRLVRGCCCFNRDIPW